MKIHYFFHRERMPESGIILAAYLENTIDGEIFYERLEYISLAVIETFNLTVSFYHEFSKNNRDSLWVRDGDELLSDIAKDQLKTIDERNYIRFRKAALNMYKNTEIIDFNMFRDIEDRKINETFQYGKVKLKCVEKHCKKGYYQCKDCYFYDLFCESMVGITGNCDSELRKDGKNVIFIEDKQAI